MMQYNHMITYVQLFSENVLKVRFSTQIDTHPPCY